VVAEVVAEEVTEEVTEVTEDMEVTEDTGDMEDMDMEEEGVVGDIMVEVDQPVMR
jgi:hypothetical protein